jgi:tRNA(Ile)-lysidine synthase TilS/MesJ
MAETRRLKGLVESVFDRVVLPASPLVVALSGGADSAALAYLCREAERDLRALHIDHGLTHSPMMVEAARRVADRLDVPLEVVEVTVAEGALASLRFDLPPSTDRCSLSAGPRSGRLRPWRGCPTPTTP